MFKYGTTDTFSHNGLTIAVSRDEHSAPGIAYFSAHWALTGNSATGYARSVRLDRWSDGKWRAPGQTVGHKRPHDAAIAWLEA